MTLGFIIILIVAFGYASNWLNGKYLNYRLTHFTYYLGAFVHESSHALLCLLTNAKIEEFEVFSAQPHVTHRTSRWPIIGSFLISSAPIYGGLFFIFLINHFVLHDHFSIQHLGSNGNDVLIQAFNFITQIRPWEWQSWVMFVLFLNIGAMLGPSFQDIKNIWPLLILMCFVQSPTLTHLGLIALSLILVNIFIQLLLIAILKIFRVVKHKRFSVIPN